MFVNKIFVGTTVPTNFEETITYKNDVRNDIPTNVLANLTVNID